ncbi:hypothetical protein PBY51_017160 [Eleginops maclovinus]|uniref:C-type lectin domain-containing protein n=1 Tax=Eleginops maclovinus TaxID=56733 RepID=A0AAN8AMH6_ELEMC|nr:hypothetical protein PBY51_017160 [Eleginops maclovinus]
MYVNSPANRRTNGEQQRGPPHAGGSKTYVLVAVSFVLLCIVQSALNISYWLRAAEWSAQCNNATTSNFTNMSAGDIEALLLEKDRLVQEKDQLLLQRDQLSKEKMELIREKERVIRERDNLAKEKHQLLLEKDRLVQEKDQLLLERDQLSKENMELIREKERVIRERDNLAKEKHQLLLEKDRLVQEKDQLLLQRDQLSKEKMQLAREKERVITNLVKKNTMLGQKVTELQNQIKISEQAPPCCPQGWQQQSTCYQLSSSKNTWEYARQDCASKGSHLVILNDEAEEKVVRGFGGDGTIWMGLSGRRNGYTNNWEMTLVDSSPLRYTNWEDNIPEVARNYYCATVYCGSRCCNTWSLGSCRERHYWMCEMQLRLP